MRPATSIIFSVPGGTFGRRCDAACGRKLRPSSRRSPAPLAALRAIQKRLRDGTYAFSPKWGYAKRKSGGSRRGITVQGLSDRIVQRAILNVIYTRDPALRKCLGSIPEVLNVPTSFAGTPGRGVPEAIALAVRTIDGGAKAFAVSDMKDFFPCVPRNDVVQLVKENVHDDEFAALFGAVRDGDPKPRRDRGVAGALSDPRGRGGAGIAALGAGGQPLPAAFRREDERGRADDDSLPG